jgi:FkbM family methyltransferase
MTGNVYTGLHDFADMGYLLHVLRDTDLFVDVGANVGSYTILACAAVGARAIAFEPAPQTHARLVENVRVNGAQSRVTCLNVGVGRDQGTVWFSGGSDTTNHIAATDEGGPDLIEVAVRTLDSAVAGESPSLVKIDVEGYELPALEGAQRILANPSLHSMIIELNGSANRYGFDESRIVRMMWDKGFQMCSYDPFNRRLIDLGERSNAEGNTLFVRNREFVAHRLATAPPFRILGKRV